ncbi:MAG: hypothetical protein FJY37_14120 [Betaproteobacteria bacterium]|nr:hypothetical protein [Betaproteobacteria bacterium]
MTAQVADLIPWHQAEKILDVARARGLDSGTIDYGDGHGGFVAGLFQSRGTEYDRGFRQVGAFVGEIVSSVRGGADQEAQRDPDGDGVQG